MADLLKLGKYGLGFLGKAVGGVRSAVTGMRGAGSTARATTPVTSTPRGGMFETLTRPRGIIRTPEIPKQTLNLRPAGDIKGRVVDGLIPARQGLDEAFDLLKTRKPKSPEIKEVKKLINAADKGKMSADEAFKTSLSSVQDITDEVANPAYARSIAQAERVAMINKNLSTAGQIGAAAAGFSPAFIDDENEPEWLKTAANFALALPGSAMATRGAVGLVTRDKRFRDIAKLLGGLGLTGAGAYGLATAGNEAAAADEAVSTPIIPPATTPGTEAAADPLQEAIANINAQAEAQLQAVDASVGSALEELIAAYGGDSFFQQALAENDQTLAMELAAIEADANAARSQIAANYDGAIAQVEGYATQAGEVLSQAAADQQAFLETAAGGLQNLGVPSGMAAGEAAASGVSDTAVGGAGITGAALLRTQGAAGASQATAERAAVVTSLSDQAATGRLNQADVMSALERGVIDAQQAARIDSANRKSKIREAQNQAKLDVAKIKYETEAQAAQLKAEIEAKKLAQELSLRQTYAQLTPEQRAAYTGRPAGQRTLPSWATEIAGDQNANVAKAGSKIKVILRDRNELVSILTAYALAPENPSDSSGALAYWVGILQSLQKTDPAITRKLEALGLPFTAPQLAAQFSTTK